MVEDMIGHYQKLQDLDEGFPDMLKKSHKRKKGELFRKNKGDEIYCLEIQFPLVTKVVNVDSYTPSISTTQKSMYKTPKTEADDDSD